MEPSDDYFYFSKPISLILSKRGASRTDITISESWEAKHIVSSVIDFVRTELLREVTEKLRNKTIKGYNVYTPYYERTPNDSFAPPLFSTGPHPHKFTCVLFFRLTQKIPPSKVPRSRNQKVPKLPLFQDPTPESTQSDK